MFSVMLCYPVCEYACLDPIDDDERRTHSFPPVEEARPTHLSLSSLPRSFASTQVPPPRSFPRLPDAPPRAGLPAGAAAEKHGRDDTHARMACRPEPCIPCSPRPSMHLPDCFCSRGLSPRKPCRPSLVGIPSTHARSPSWPPRNRLPACQSWPRRRTHVRSSVCV